MVVWHAGRHMQALTTVNSAIYRTVYTTACPLHITLMGLQLMIMALSSNCNTVVVSRAT